MSEQPCKAQTEVYSRVSGFFRTVQQWNRGKKEEYRQRQNFSLQSQAPAAPGDMERG